VDTIRRDPAKRLSQYSVSFYNYVHRLGVNMKSIAFLFLPMICGGFIDFVPTRGLERCGAGEELANFRGGEGLLDATRGTEYIVFGSLLDVGLLSSR